MCTCVPVRVTNTNQKPTCNVGGLGERQQRLGELGSISGLGGEAHGQGGAFPAASETQNVL